ncbi:hypothetical protein HID58_040961, partial [Brassica napus]
MTSFLSLDSKIGAWSSSFRSTPKQPDEAMRVLEGKAFELDVNLEVVQPLTARQLSFACLYLASANWLHLRPSLVSEVILFPTFFFGCSILSGRSSQSSKHGTLEISERHHLVALQILLFNCFSNLLLPHLNLWCPHFKKAFFCNSQTLSVYTQRPICQRMIHMLLDMAVDTSESARPPCRQWWLQREGVTADDLRRMKPAAAKPRRIHALDRRQPSQTSDGRGKVSTNLPVDFTRDNRGMSRSRP